MRRSDRSASEHRLATVCHQSLSIDMAFIVQKSKNSDRYIDNIGIKGETCYVLITDYFSGMIHGKVLVNKAPPIKYFNQWLARFSPEILDKTVRFDQGGELGRSRRVIKLFQDQGYTVQLTGADSSHQNGLVEHSHQTLGNMMRSLLHGSSLPRKFWPYAFYHAVFILNRIPHHDKASPPITLCTGRRLSLASLRVFGCRVYPVTAKQNLTIIHDQVFFLVTTKPLKMYTGMMLNPIRSKRPTMFVLTKACLTYLILHQMFNYSNALSMTTSCPMPLN